MIPKAWAVDIASIFEPAQKFPTFGKLVSVIIANIVTVAGVVALFLLLLGGLSYIAGAGGGDSKRIEQGKKTLTYAALGLVIIVFAIWIVQIIIRILGLQNTIAF